MAACYFALSPFTYRMMYKLEWQHCIWLRAPVWNRHSRTNLWQIGKKKKFNTCTFYVHVGWMMWVRVCVYVHVDVVRMHTLRCICMYCRMRHIVQGYRHAHTFFTGFIMWNNAINLSLCGTDKTTDTERTLQKPKEKVKSSNFADFLYSKKTGFIWQI